MLLTFGFTQLPAYDFRPSFRELAVSGHQAATRFGASERGAFRRGRVHADLSARAHRSASEHCK